MLLCLTGIQYCSYNVVAIMADSNNIGSSTLSVQHSDHAKRTVQRPVDDPAALILEAWSQGLMTGSLFIMAAVTYANMRPGVLLHKLILLEVGLLPLMWNIRTNVPAS